MSDYPDITTEWRDVAIEAMENTRVAIAQRDEAVQMAVRLADDVVLATDLIRALNARVGALNAENADLTTRLIGGTA